MFKKAFTLVELAVSMMIISLLVALISGGSTLLANAKANKLLREMLSIKQAFSLFESTFDALPGDFKDAYSYWGDACDTTAAECNGNGNGQIAESVSENESYTESKFVFHHLNLSGILKRGNYTPSTDESYEYDLTFAAYDTQGVVYYPDSVENFPEGAQNWLQIGSGALEAGAYLQPKWAHKLDKKIDNGLPWTGVFTIMDSTGALGDQTVNFNCTGDGQTVSNVYQLSNNVAACNTLFDMDS